MSSDAECPVCWVEKHNAEPFPYEKYVRWCSLEHVFLWMDAKSELDDRNYVEINDV